MENNTSEEIMDKLKKVCVCKNITRAAIKAAIKGGADTLEEIKKSTGAGTGSCKGARCMHVIEEILEEMKEKR